MPERDTPFIRRVIILFDQPRKSAAYPVGAEVLAFHRCCEVEQAAHVRPLMLKTQKSRFNAPHRLFVEPVQKLVAALVVFVYLHLQVRMVAVAKLIGVRQFF